MKTLSRGVVFLTILLGIIIVGGFLLIQSVYTVQYGTVGVIIRFGQIVNDEVNPGLHLKVPFVDQVLVYRTQKIVYQTLYDGSGSSNISSDTGGSYPAAEPESSNSSLYYDERFVGGTQSASYADYQDVAIDTTTKDGQQVKITYSIRFSLDPTKIKEIANNLGTEAEVVEKIVKTDSRVWARNIPRSYSALDLYTGNIDKVSEEIQEVLKPIFEKNGLILDEFYIRSIHFTAEYVQTIENKQIEKEKIATEEFIAQQEEFRKQAAITKAQGEAEAQRLQQQTLTRELINKMYIEKWNGVLPTTVTGDSSGLLLNLNK